MGLLSKSWPFDKLTEYIFSWITAMHKDWNLAEHAPWSILDFRFWFGGSAWRQLQICIQFKHIYKVNPLVRIIQQNFHREANEVLNWVSRFAFFFYDQYVHLNGNTCTDHISYNDNHILIYHISMSMWCEHRFYN